MAWSGLVTQRGWIGGVAAILVMVTGTGIAADGTHFVWFGTYTGKNTGGEGIYVSRFDAQRGTLSAPALAVAAVNPSFLAVHPRLPVLYAVAETAAADGKPTGAVLAFAIDETTGKLRLMNQQLSGGGGPCAMSVDRSGQAVVAANYGGGSVICLGLAADGSLRPVVTGTPGGFVQHTFDRAGDTGINPARQEKPHAHSADISPDGRFAFACDLGLDQVVVYTLDAARATIARHSMARTRNGAGPRHFALHPSGTFAYCVNELDLTVSAFSFDARSGALEPLQTLSAVPADVTDRKGFSGAEIAVHPTGRFVYASIRGYDAISIFTVDQATGRLGPLGVEPIRGKTPRHFALSPDGGFLLAEGQSSNSVAVFSVDPMTGMLRFVDYSITVPSPVSAVFRRID